MTLQEAKQALDKVIKKGRVHLYKPIQVAEILYRDRINGDIDLDNVESYRNRSKAWRDQVCMKLVGRVSNSSAKYQDDLFNANAVPPAALVLLGDENRQKNGIVESYIYDQFESKYKQLANGFKYVDSATRHDFKLEEFIDLFRKVAGLKRSVDKIYEIIVYSLFVAIVDHLNLTIEIKIDEEKMDVLQEFEDFARSVILIDAGAPVHSSPARIFRVGVTNAADRGLDMWANFGPAIQVKHLSLDEELAEDIVDSVTADRVVIVCKTSEEKVIASLLTQLGWRARIQSIVTEAHLLDWYERALRGQFSDKIGDQLLDILKKEFVLEFPSADPTDFNQMYTERGYDEISDANWALGGANPNLFNQPL